MRAAILLFEGVDELDAIAPYEVLTMAARAGADLSVSLATLEPRTELRGAHGLWLRPDEVLPDALDLVLVPGGGWNDRAPAGAWAEVARGDLPRAVAARHAAGAVAASVCTGGMVLAAAGLVRGRPAVTHHLALDELRAAGALVQPDVRVVDDGDLVTAGGVTSGLDLALWLVERQSGAELAEEIAADVEHRRGPVLTASGER
jgi:transcriptional regulator GlxA family with amidase domain